MVGEGPQQGFGLDDFLLVFRLRAKTGVLQLMHGDQHGAIYVVSGRIVDAVITVARGSERTVLVDADDAMIEMLCWSDATFRYKHEPLVARRMVRIEHESDWLVQEGQRRRNPGLTLPVAPALDLDVPLQLAKTMSGTSRGVMLTTTQWEVVKAIATGAGLRQCLPSEGLDAETVLHAAADLVALGLLETAVVPPVSRDLPVPATFIAPPPVIGASGIAPRAPTPEFAQAVCALTPPAQERTSVPRPAPAQEPASAPRPAPAAAAAAFLRPQPQFATAGAALSGTRASGSSPVKRSMLNAIMSRIRSL